MKKHDLYMTTLERTGVINAVKTIAKDAGKCRYFLTMATGHPAIIQQKAGDQNGVIVTAGSSDIMISIMNIDPAAIASLLSCADYVTSANSDTTVITRLKRAVYSAEVSRKEAEIMTFKDKDEAISEVSKVFSIMLEEPLTAKSLRTHLHMLKLIKRNLKLNVDIRHAEKHGYLVA